MIEELAQAPDFAEPIVGWRVWYAVERDRKLSLRSLFFGVDWPPGEMLEAGCHRRRLIRRRSSRPGHQAPDDRCDCGIYAGKLDAAKQHRLELLQEYLARPLLTDTDALHHVVGTVSLWGSVVECERGWRARFAYPKALFVPTQSFRARPTRSPREIALALERYRVPTEVVATEQPRDLFEALASAVAVAGR